MEETNQVSGGVFDAVCAMADRAAEAQRALAKSTTEVKNGLLAAIADALDAIPTTTLSGHIGNPGAGGGAIQTIASLLALEYNELFPILNYGVADSDCRINATRVFGVDPGDSFIKLCANASGQTSAVYLRRFRD